MASGRITLTATALSRLSPAARIACERGLAPPTVTTKAPPVPKPPLSRRRPPRRPWILYGVGAILALGVILAVPLDFAFLRPQGPAPQACALEGTCGGAAAISAAGQAPMHVTAAPSVAAEPSQPTAGVPASAKISASPSRHQWATPHPQATQTPAVTTTAPQASSTTSTASSGGGTLVSAPAGKGTVQITRYPGGGGTITETFPAQPAQGSGLPVYVRASECLLQGLCH